VRAKRPLACCGSLPFVFYLIIFTTHCFKKINFIFHLFKKGRSMSSQRLIAHLQRRGASTSVELQAALRVSQPTASRLLAGLSGQVLTLGRGRASRYALAQPIGPYGAQHTLWAVDGNGQAQALGSVSLLARSQLHLAASGVDILFEPSAAQELPWLLAPLRAEGFLGRLQAARLAALGVSSDPARWGLHDILLAALHTHDAPGRLWLGDVGTTEVTPLPPLPADQPGPLLDALATDVARTLPAGSSAGGEQPKFLATAADGQPLLVKFSPPLGTPFGDRWSDLLHAESLASRVLQQHGQATAQSVAITTEQRTYLVSQRFDRIGASGRAHVVALGAVHAAFVPGAWTNWASTCDALARQRRLSAADSQSAAFRLQFGRLIGNTDMHSGNASVRVLGDTLAQMLRGQFELAPSYDMLPMRFKPDPVLGLPDYAAFEPDTRLMTTATQAAAADFWTLLSQLPGVSEGLRELAASMRQRIVIGT